MENCANAPVAQHIPVHKASAASHVLLSVVKPIASHLSSDENPSNQLRASHVPAGAMDQSFSNHLVNGAKPR
jgi:hypothetical protein